jgi:hypothetical protein
VETWNILATAFMDSPRAYNKMAAAFSFAGFPLGIDRVNETHSFCSDAAAYLNADHF